MDKLQQLRDIKGVVEVHDTSLWQLLGLVVSLILLTAIVAYLMKRKMRKKRRFRKTAQELARERIEAIDYNDPKSVAYTFIEDVAHFVDDEQRVAYEAIVEALKPYKYKKVVPEMDEALKKRIEAFIEAIGRRKRWKK